MRHKLPAAVFVVCASVAVVGISLLLYFFQTRPAVLAASTSRVSPTAIPVTAVLEIFEGPVSVMLPDREATEEARTGMPIPQGTIVSTGTTGRAQIIYPGGTVTRLDNSTTIKLTTFNSQKYQIIVNIFQGKIWSRIKKLLGTESYETQTSNTVATVRGTSYEHSVTELDEDSILVLEGKVDFECTDYQNLKTSLNANKKAKVHCNTDTTLESEDITPQDLQKDWVKFNTVKNNNLEDQLKKEIDPSIAVSTPTYGKEKVKNKDVSPTDGVTTSITEDTPDKKNNDKDKRNGKDKEKKNPSPTSILNVQPTAIVGAVVNTVIPTLPPLLPTNAPVPPTHAPAATATLAPAGVNVDVNVGDLNAGVGLGKGKLKINLGNGN